MGPDRIANKILTFRDDRQTQVLWVREVHQNLLKCGIRGKGIGNREMFRKKISKVKGLWEGKGEPRGCYWKKNEPEIG